MDQDLFYSGTDIFPRLKAVALRLYVSASMGLDRVQGARGQALRKAMSTENLVLLCLVLAAWALAQFTPLGPAVDLFLTYVGYATLAEQLFGALDGARQWAVAAYYATDKAALDRAATLAASALGQVEADMITDLVSYGGFVAARGILRFFRVGDFAAAAQRVTQEGTVEGSDGVQSKTGQGAEIIDDTPPKPQAQPEPPQEEQSPPQEERPPEEQLPPEEESQSERWKRRMSDLAHGTGAMTTGQAVGGALDSMGSVLLMLLLAVFGTAGFLLWLRSRGRR